MELCQIGVVRVVEAEVVIVGVAAEEEVAVTAAEIGLEVEKVEVLGEVTTVVGVAGAVADAKSVEKQPGSPE